MTDKEKIEKLRKIFQSWPNDRVTSHLIAILDAPETADSPESPSDELDAKKKEIDREAVRKRLRDRFAIAALPALITFIEPGVPSDDVAVACAAYSIADAMLAERGRGETK